MVRSIMDNKSYFDLTEAEIDQRSELNPKEKTAVDAFIAAAKALPKSICIDVDSNEGEPNLKVSKRITRGAAQQVAALRKKSLCF